MSEPCARGVACRVGLWGPGDEHVSAGAERNFAPREVLRVMSRVRVDMNVLWGPWGLHSSMWGCQFLIQFGAIKFSRREVVKFCIFKFGLCLNAKPRLLRG